MHENDHDASGVSVVFQPEPGRLMVFSHFNCGCFAQFAMPSPLVQPDVIKSWFEVRRDLRQYWEDADG